MGESRESHLVLSDEFNLGFVGRALAGAERWEDARELFEWNVEASPESKDARSRSRLATSSK